MNTISEPVAVRVAKDGTTQRVPLGGDAGKILREQIGCQMLEVVVLDSRLDVWLDEEALVWIDFNDRSAVTAELNLMATLVASRLGQVRQPLFGVAVFAARAGSEPCGLSAEQLAEVEDHVSLFANGVAARVSGGGR